MIYFSELGGGGHITKALHRCPASLPGVHRAVEPPDPIPNSEVKRSIADGSVGSPHVRVGQRQALTLKALYSYTELLFSKNINFTLVFLENKEVDFNNFLDIMF